MPELSGINPKQAVVEDLWTPPRQSDHRSPDAHRTESGLMTQSAFVPDRQRRRLYHLRVTEEYLDEPDLGENTLVDATAQGIHPLIHLLETVIDEITAQQP